MACKFGDRCHNENCIYYHGKSTKKNIQCKFGNKCRNNDCDFLHDSNTNVYTTPNIKHRSTILCKFGNRCNNKENCDFLHENDADNSNRTCGQLNKNKNCGIALSDSIENKDFILTKIYSNEQCSGSLTLTEFLQKRKRELTEELNKIDSELQQLTI